MTTTTYIPPLWEVEDEAKAIPKLMQLFQRVSNDITGETRWVGSPKQVRKGEGRYRNVFRDLLGNLRQWGFDPEQYLRWVISTYPTVLQQPRWLNENKKLSHYKEHRARNLSDVVNGDTVVRGKSDLIRTGMEAAVETLEGWKTFMPSYRDRLLHLYHSISTHYLATDEVFLGLMKENFIKPEVHEKVREVIVEFGHKPWFWEQVRNARNAAVRVVTGE